MAAQLEICVDTLDGVLAAKDGGAARVELCAALSEGGLTPSTGLMQAAARMGIPCYAMIRPHSGLFRFDARDDAIMLADIAAAKAAGLAGVVLGVQRADGRLDTDRLARLCAAAGPMGKTLHRVIDVVPDPFEALDQAIDLGFDRVLTSGTAPEAPDGQAMIKRMVDHAQGRISIMPGCGLTPENVCKLVAETGVTEVHAACARPVAGDRAFSDFDPPNGRMETSVSDVRRMVAALKA